jgi:hypothetical protein
VRIRGQYESLLQETHKEIKKMEEDVKQVQHRQRDREDNKDHII